MNTDDKVRIRIVVDGIVNWFVQVGTRQQDSGRCARECAASLHRDAAREMCRRLRTNSPNDTIEVVAANGVVLFADETTPTLPETEDTRKPVFDTVSLVRIVPGAAGAWYIRFPNSSYESIRGVTAKETLKKYNEHPQHLELSKFVEKYVSAAPEPPPDTKKIQRQIEKEILNGRKRRPGDR